MNRTGAPLGPLRAVVFDVGEVLIDETRQYGEWADWLGIPRHTFSAVFGAVVARGENHQQTFQHFRPGLDLALERRRREEARRPEAFGPEDLYPDARACLAELQARGFVVGVAANQPEPSGGQLRSLGLPVDWIGTSGAWGVEKPSPEFFGRVVAQCGCAAAEIAYVGDRLDNDIRPALSAGMVSVFLRRGPWAHLAPPGAETRAHISVESLAELPGLLGQATS